MPEWLQPWLPLANSILTLIVGALLWGVRKAYSTLSDDATQEGRVKALEMRMDRAGKEASTLASKVQGLPETLRLDFVGREAFDAHVKANDREHDMLRGDVQAMRKRCDDCVAAWRARRHE